MRRLVHVCWTYLLCLIVGLAVGLSLRPSTAQMAREEMPLTLILPPAEAPASVPSRATPAPVRASPLPPPIGPGSSSMPFQEWVRERLEAGQTEVAHAAFLKIESLEVRQGIAAAFAADSQYLDPGFVTRMVMSLPPGPAADKALGRLLSEWSSLDADEALRFMETLPVERFNDLSLGSCAFGLGQLPAERVAAFVGKLDPKARGWFMEVLLGTLDQTGSWTNLQRIMDLVSFTSSKDSIPDFFLGMRIAEAAPLRVEAWIREETNPIRRDQLISGYTRSRENGEPAAAVRWDVQIQDADTRREEVRRHLHRWLETDRAAALAWLRGSEARSLLPMEQRSPLLRSYGLEAAP